MNSVDYQLTNGKLTRVDLDTDHYYWLDQQYCISVTRVLDIAAPFPEGLRNYLRDTNADESKANMEYKRNRGSDLHDALDRLMRAKKVLSADYPTSYEKNAIATFIRFIRFLQPERFQTEIPVADAGLRVAGTLDFVGWVDPLKLPMLLEPNKYLEIDTEGNFKPNRKAVEEFLILSPKLTKDNMKQIIIDWKFTARNAFNHQVQVAAYREMHAKSYGEAPQRAFTWRYSPQHKFGFDFCESTLQYESFERIYQTAIEYLGKFPEPPSLTVWPEQFELYKSKREK